MRLLLLALLLLAACQKPEVQPVLARVNGEEILADEAPSRQSLERVIDRELLAQKALEAGLERDPLVAQALDAARRHILAQAWLERRSAGTVARLDEVRAFYGENPALFGERRIYKLRTLEISAGAGVVDVLRAEVLAARDLEDVAAWLRLRNAAFRPGASTQGAEQLPLTYLSRLASMKEGEIAVFDAPAGAAVVQLVQAQDAPLSEREAAPLIGEFLSGRKRLEVAAVEVKRLRAAARIEYVAEPRAR
ncbi:MAG TPA: EpsD family peptidyl-prolyl cis-trans isomerase [Burkholderiales bacterium]|jgi:EpsD family peptidyl-prolyl cis-trans isomerase